MFEKIKEAIQARAAARQIANNPILQAGQEAIHKYWIDNPAMNKDFSEGFIQQHSEAMMAGVLDIAGSTNPTMANRERLAELTLEYARLQVLIMDPAPEQDPTTLRGQPGITGELQAHLVEIAEKQKDFYELIEQSGIERNQQDIYDLTLLRYRMLFAYTHVHHMLRLPLDDWNSSEPDKDWFRPLIGAFCAAAEHQCRKAIDMKPVLTDSFGRPDPDDQLGTVMELAFINAVMDGEKHPHLVWRDKVDSYLQLLDADQDLYAKLDILKTVLRDEDQA